ncbi:2',3'-cyclic-nucleotide 2'-phosphodiesterase (5'-nucleotidase family) [Lactobacillus colini]|uniref:2',3'-cyclic-nucleotide 2'-phosphodiesterase (5'-nucleotidase family) n=1 Tax=Lactobacillus colini TaxID=1819254 RepID=A0ABS4MFX0_9LACO|nr:bifunctional UDP-sugar hydrolase/5'-nucleotidase [Lactobacillus colini]MBP2058589.1 2',3'-cyclic-nucleotide 2'-phosphodiesterase (5'-nucleotidase family) [Lactobacillus colini]
MEKLRILHTNDLHSHFEQFPKIGRYLRKAQADTSVDQVFTFDAGDFMDRSHPLSDATEGQANIALMNELHYDAITIGNNEGISNSHQVLERLFTHAEFPVLLANLHEEDESFPKWCNPYEIIKTKKGTRIAMVGLTAAYPMTYGPNHWHVKLISETMDKVLPELEGKYDILIVISHIGLTMDRYLAKHYPEINLIIGGHSHDLIPNGEKVNNTWIVQTGKWGHYIGDIQIELDVDHHITKIRPQTIATSSLPAAEGDAEFVERLSSQGTAVLRERTIAKLPLEFTQDKLLTIKVSLDAISSFAGTDIAVLNSGLFLDSFKSGVITEDDLQYILPHPMHVVKTRLRGSDVWRMVMEMEKNRHFLKKFPLKGMSFRGKIFGNIIYKGISVDEETRTVYINGQEIDPYREYELALLDHYVLIPFFPTISIMGENKFLFPDYLRTVVGDYLSKKYPLD